MLTDPVERDEPEIVDLGRGRPLSTTVDCRECPEVFTGATAWPDYARHIRDAHPQTIPSPAQLKPGEPVAIKTSSAIVGEKEAPAMAKEYECPDCLGGFLTPQSVGAHRRYRCPAIHGAKPVQGNGGGPAVEPDPGEAEPLPPGEGGGKGSTGVATGVQAGPVERGGSLPAFVSFDSLAPHLEAAEVALRQALGGALQVRFEDGTALALVDVDSIEVFVSGQRVINLTGADRDEVAS